MKRMMVVRKQQWAQTENEKGGMSVVVSDLSRPFFQLFPIAVKPSRAKTCSSGPMLHSVSRSLFDLGFGDRSLSYRPIVIHSAQSHSMSAHIGSYRLSHPFSQHQQAKTEMSRHESLDAAYPSVGCLQAQPLRVQASKSCC